MTYIIFNAFAVHKEASSAIVTSYKGLLQEMSPVNGMPRFAYELVIYLDAGIGLEVALHRGDFLERQVSLVLVIGSEMKSILKTAKVTPLKFQKNWVKMEKSSDNVVIN